IIPSARVDLPAFFTGKQETTREGGFTILLMLPPSLNARLRTWPHLAAASHGGDVAPPPGGMAPHVPWSLLAPLWTSSDACHQGRLHRPVYEVLRRTSDCSAATLGPELLCSARS